MPKSKLWSGLDTTSVNAVEVTKREVSVDRTNNIVRLRFPIQRILARIRKIGSFITDEVEYDTHINWRVSPILQWAKLYYPLNGYYNSVYLCGHSIAKTPDNGIVVADPAMEPAHVTGIVVKLNGKGDPLWAKKVSNTTWLYWNTMPRVAVDSNGNIFFAYLDYDISPNYGILLMKFDPDGNLLFSKHIYYDYGPIYPVGMSITAGDEVVLIGYYGTTDTNAPINEHGSLVLKFDNDGNVLWSKTFVDSAFSKVCRCLGGGVTSSGDIIVCAAYHPGTTVMKIDPDGNLVSAYAFGNPNDLVALGYVAGTCIDPDGNLIVATYGNPLNDFSVQWLYVLKADPDGSIVWAKRYITENQAALYAYDVISLDDGSIVIPAPAEFDENGQWIYSAVLLKLDPNGNQVWAKRYNYGLVQMIGVDKYNDGFVLTGSASSQVEEDTSVMIVARVDSTGHIPNSMLQPTDLVFSSEDVDVVYNTITLTEGQAVVNVTDFTPAITDVELQVTAL